MELTLDDVRRLLESDDTDYDRVAELGPSLLVHLKVLSASGDPRIDAKATYLAAKIGGSDADAIVARGLASPDTRVRQSAAAALFLPGVTTDPSAVDRLLDDADADVRKVALISLADAGQVEEHLAKVSRIAADDPTPFVRDLAAGLEPS